MSEGTLILKRKELKLDEMDSVRHANVVGIVDSWPMHPGSDKYVVIILVQVP